MKSAARTILLGVAAATAAACPAFAQQAATASRQDATQETPSDAQLEEVMVTAERRQTPLQETPISITALTAAALEARGINNLNALDAYTPNLQLNNGRPDGGGSTASATIRGVGQNDFQFPNDPGVGTYVDGVYIARSLGGLMSTLD